MSDEARRAWSQMRDLVLERDRRVIVADAVGMSFQRAKALIHIASGEIAHRALAAELAMDQPYTTVIIKDLLDRGLVETRANPKDGRSKLVSITPAGAALAEKASMIMSEPPAALTALAAADLDELSRILGLLGAG